MSKHFRPLRLLAQSGAAPAISVRALPHVSYHLLIFDCCDHHNHLSPVYLYTRYGTDARTSTHSPKRATLPPTATALLINEPTKDRKGKKRAASDSENETSAAGPSSSKRTRKMKKDATSTQTARKPSRYVSSDLVHISSASLVLCSSLSSPGQRRRERAQRRLNQSRTLVRLGRRPTT